MDFTSSVLISVMGDVGNDILGQPASSERPVTLSFKQVSLLIRVKGAFWNGDFHVRYQAVRSFSSVSNDYGLSLIHI